MINDLLIRFPVVRELSRSDIATMVPKNREAAAAA
jgi:hypothetical protein